MGLPKPPRKQLPAMFFERFSDPAAAAAARHLEAWATRRSLIFQLGDAVESRDTYYVRVPDTKPPYTLLTLQSDEAFLDIPFRRMRGGRFGERQPRLEFLERLRQAIPTRQWDDRVVEDAKHGFAPIEWRHLTDPAARDRFIQVLDWAIISLRAAA